MICSSNCCTLYCAAVALTHNSKVIFNQVSSYTLCTTNLQVSRIARLMVTQLGFCPELGQVSWSGGGGGMMASQMGQQPETSMATADKIDNEVRGEKDSQCKGLQQNML